MTLPTRSDVKDITDHLFRKVAWRILPLTAICYALAIIDRINISFANLEMSPDIGLSQAAYGLGAGIFFIAYIIFEVPSNMVLERVGARVWLTRILITWGAITVLTAFVQNTGQFYLARVLLGIAEAGFYPGIVFFLASWFPAKRLARALALFVIAGPLASMFVGPFSAWIMTTLGADGTGLAGWRWVFILQGVPAVILGFVFFLAIRNSPKDVRWLDDTEKRVLLTAVGKTDRKPEKAWKQLRTAVSTGRIWALGTILGAAYLGIYASIFWLPSILAHTGISNLTTIGWLSALPPLLGVALTITLGVLSDRTQKHRTILVTTLVVAAISLTVSVAFGNQTATMLIGIAVATACFTASGPVIWTVSNFQLANATVAAAGIALINTIGSIGSFVGPYIMGLGSQITGSVAPPLLGIAAFAVVGALVVLALPRRPLVREREYPTDKVTVESVDTVPPSQMAPSERPTPGA